DCRRSSAGSGRTAWCWPVSPRGRSAGSRVGSPTPSVPTSPPSPTASASCPAPTACTWTPSAVGGPCCTNWSPRGRWARRCAPMAARGRARALTRAGAGSGGCGVGGLGLGLAQAPSALTLPALRQEVHTLTRLLVPLITVRTDWMFGFQRRECRRCEWDTLLPKRGLLAQMSHVEAATVVSWYVD